MNETEARALLEAEYDAVLSDDEATPRCPSCNARYWDHDYTCRRVAIYAEFIPGWKEAEYERDWQRALDYEETQKHWAAFRAKHGRDPNLNDILKWSYRADRIENLVYSGNPFLAMLKRKP